MMEEKVESAGRSIRAAAFIAITAASSCAWPHAAEACSVCFGDPESPQTQGIGYAILFLLLVVGGVLAALAAFFVRLMRMSRLAAEPGARNERTAAMAHVAGEQYDEEHSA